MTDAVFAASRRLVQRRFGPVAPATAVLCLMVAIGAIVLMFAGRHLTFFADEWVWIQYQRHGSLLAPYNDHFSLFPLAVYRVLFALFGMRHYTPYRAVGVGLDLLCPVLLYILVRRRLGAWPALVPAALLMFMGTGAEDLLWPFQIGFLGSVAGGLGALILIENRRSDPLAAALLVWSIASSGVGLAFVASGFVLILAQRDPWRRLWIVAVPVLVFAVWYLGWGTSKPITTHAIATAPSVVAAAAADVASAMAGFPTLSSVTVDNAWGPALAVGMLLAFAAFWRRTGGGSPAPMLMAALAGVLIFWALIALQRTGFRNRDTSRYLYIGAVFVWVILSEARWGRRPASAWLGLAGLVVLGAFVANLGVLRDTERGLRELDDQVRASLTAVEIAAPVVRPAYVAFPTRAPEIISGPYLAAVRALGSPAFGVPELLRAPVSLRQRADVALEGAEALRPVPAAVASTCPAVASATVTPGQTVVVQDNGSTAATVSLRRFEPAFLRRFAIVPAHSARTISFPADRAPGLPWHLSVAPAASSAVCVQ